MFIRLHISAASTFLLTLGIQSDAAGTGRLGLPIPASLALLGTGYFAQSLWFEHAATGQTCSHGAFRLVTSRGLSLRFQP